MRPSGRPPSVMSKKTTGFSAARVGLATGPDAKLKSAALAGRAFGVGPPSSTALPSLLAPQPILERRAGEGCASVEFQSTGSSNSEIARVKL